MHGCPTEKGRQKHHMKREVPTYLSVASSDSQSGGVEPCCR